eukprot:3814935-Amphidinium_carterae.2
MLQRDSNLVAWLAVVLEGEESCAWPSAAVLHETYSLLGLPGIALETLCDLRVACPIDRSKLCVLWSKLGPSTFMEDLSTALFACWRLVSQALDACTKSMRAQKQITADKIGELVLDERMERIEGLSAESPQTHGGGWAKHATCRQHTIVIESSWRSVHGIGACAEEPEEAVMRSIWSQKNLSDALRLLSECSWSTQFTEKQHAAAAVVHRHHPKYSLDTLQCRAFLYTYKFGRSDLRSFCTPVFLGTQGSFWFAFV